MSSAEVAQSVEQGTENPRVGSSILSLGTRNSSTYEIFVGAFFVLKGPKSGTISIRRQFKLLISQQNKLENRGF